MNIGYFGFRPYLFFLIFFLAYLNIYVDNDLQAQENNQYNWYSIILTEATYISNWKRVLCS